MTLDQKPLDLLRSKVRAAATAKVATTTPTSPDPSSVELPPWLTSLS
jgi:hypothetical protein